MLIVRDQKVENIYQPLFFQYRLKIKDTFILVLLSLLKHSLK